MNLFKRAMLNITRNNAKYTSLFLLFSILAFFLSILLQIHQASQRVQQNVISNMNPQAMIGWDWNAQQAPNPDFFGHQSTVWPLEVSLLQEIAALPYVKDYNLFLERKLLSQDLEWFTHSKSGQNVRTELGIYFTIRGVPRSNFTEIEMDIIELLSGRNFTLDEIEMSLPKALISEEFALKNQLGIGSVVPLRSVVMNLNMPEVNWIEHKEDHVLGYLMYNVEIIGIFRMNQRVTGDTYSNLIYNRFYVPNGFLQKINYEINQLEAELGFTEHLSYLHSIAWNKMSHEEGFPIMATLATISEFFSMHINSFFILRSPYDIIPFTEIVEPMLPEFYLVEFADNHFLEIMNALNAVERNSETSLYVMVGATVLIVCILIIILLRQRMNEIGLYLSAGEQKTNIAVQILLEKILVKSPAVIFAFISSRVFMRFFSENIIVNQLIANIGNGHDTSLQRATLFEMFGFSKSYGIEATLFDNFDSSLSIGLIALFILSVLGVILILTAIALGYILRLSPKRIMMN